MTNSVLKTKSHRPSCFYICCKTALPAVGTGSTCRVVWSTYTDWRCLHPTSGSDTQCTLRTAFDWPSMICDAYWTDQHLPCDTLQKKEFGLLYLHITVCSLTFLLCFQLAAFLLAITSSLPYKWHLQTKNQLGVSREVCLLWSNIFYTAVRLTHFCKIFNRRRQVSSRDLHVSSHRGSFMPSRLLSFFPSKECSGNFPTARLVLLLCHHTNRLSVHQQKKLEAFLRLLLRDKKENLWINK